MACEREECSFMRVARTARIELPCARSMATCSLVVQAIFARSSTYGPVRGCSRTLSRGGLPPAAAWPPGLSRSRICSMWISRKLASKAHSTPPEAAAAAHSPNSAATKRGVKPGASAVPSIVYVLPEALWPYASTVTLKPSIALPSSGGASASKTRF